MPDLDFRVESAAPVQFAAAPLMGFQVAVSNAIAGETIFSISLRCQIQIEVARRRYTEQDQSRLLDLFGAPERWSQTLRTMLWTNTSTNVPCFTGQTMIEVQVPWSFDFNVAATKYFHGVRNGEIPLCFLFSGTIFYDAGGNTPQVAPVSWSKEARFRLPVEAWRQLMEIYYPNTAWLCLRRDIFDRLYRYKTQHGIPTWEAALDKILPHEETVKS